MGLIFMLMINSLSIEVIENLILIDIDVNDEHSEKKKTLQIKIQKMVYVQFLCRSKELFSQ